MITINREKLAKAAQTIAAMPERTAVHQITQTAFLSYSEGKLTLRATDMANWLALTVDADGDIFQDIQLDSQKLSEVVQKMPGDTINIAVKDGSLFLSGDNKSKRKLSGYVMQFPSVAPPVGEAEKAEGSDINAAIALAAKLMPPQDAKPDYQGVRVYDGYAIGTDGTGFFACPLPLTGEFTLAPGTASLLKHVPDGAIVEVTTSERLISFKWDGGQIISTQRLEGKWGFLKRGFDVILPVNDHFLLVHPNDLLKAINNIRPLMDKDAVIKSEVARLALSVGGCRIVTNDGESEEHFDAEWSGPDLQIKLSLNKLTAIFAGFAQDMPVSFGVTPLPAEKGCVVRQEARPGLVGMLGQIR